MKLAILLALWVVALFQNYATRRNRRLCGRWIHLVYSLGLPVREVAG